MSGRLELEPGRWYGWTMWPGYMDRAYHSPIRVEQVDWLGHELIDLQFYNAAYARGVRGMGTRLRILAHHATYLLAAIDQSQDRSVAVVPMTAGWIELYFPDQFAMLQDIAGEAGTSLDDAIPRHALSW